MLKKIIKLISAESPQQLMTIRFHWKLLRSRVFVQTLRAKFLLWRWGAVVGSGLDVSGQLRCRNFGSLCIGSGVKINSGSDRNFVGGNLLTALYVGYGGSLVIKDGVGISGTTICANQSVTIGRNTLLGGGCDIYDTDFHELNPAERLARSGRVKSAPVYIGENVFIGAHSVILKGVTIGDCSIVGAGSVVARDIPPYEIWAGNPARRIKSVARSQ